MLQPEPNFDTTATRDCYIMVCADDLLVKEDYCRLHLRGHPEAGASLANHRGSFGETLEDSYINSINEETGMNNCNTVTAPEIARRKPTIEDEALLDHEQHKRCRRVVGKPQWLAYTRPDIAYAKTEQARDLTAPTELSQKRVKRLLCYLRGANHYKFTIEPTTTL